MYKAVFVDIDGTLVDKNKKISNEAKEVIKLANENEIKIILCTGRQYIATKEIVKQCEFCKYLICSNGAEIYNSENNDVLYSSNIDYETCLNLYHFAIENNFSIRFDCKYGRFVYNALDKFPLENEITENIELFLKENNIVQISLVTPVEEKFKSIENQVENITNDMRISNKFSWKINENKYFIVNFNNKQVSKGNAMMGLSKFLKIDLKNVASIGDGINDISMLENANFGVAMENALEEVKKSADFITFSNEENGFAKALEKIINM